MEIEGCEPTRRAEADMGPVVNLYPSKRPAEGVGGRPEGTGPIYALQIRTVFTCRTQTMEETCMSTAIADHTAADSQLADYTSNRLIQIAAGTGSDSEQAWTILRDRHHGGLLRFLRGPKGLDPATAEDVAGQTWERCIKHAHRHDPSRAKFQTWLLLIASNLVKNVYRDRDRNPTIRTTTLSAGLPGDDQNFYKVRPSTAPDPEQEAINGERARLLQDALDSLKPFYRRPLELRARGFSYSEISDLSGAKLGTVKSRLARARNLFIEAAKERGVDLSNWTE